MRPRLEVRQALADAVQRLYPLKGAVSAREAAAAAQVGYEDARLTLKNMVNSPLAEIKRAGVGKEAGQRWHTLYEPVQTEEEAEQRIADAQTWADLDAAMRAFAGKTTSDT